MKKRDKKIQFALQKPLQKVVETQTEKIVPLAPSKELDNTIKNLLEQPQKRKKKQPYILHTPLKRFVVVSVILCFSAFLLGWAVTPPFYGAKVVEHTTHIDYVFAQEPKQALQSLGFTYIPEYVPQGYAQYETTIIGENAILTFINDENNEIIYKEYPATSISLDNEYDTQKVVAVAGGLQGYLVTKEDSISLSWFNPAQSRMYRISGVISEKELLKMAKSVCKL